MKPLPAFLAALLMLSAPALTARAAQPPSEQPRHPAQGRRILEVKVEGLTTLKPEVVRQAMATRKGLDFHPATYAEDFNRIYNLGYFDAHGIVLHQPRITPAGVIIVVSCTERPIVGGVLIRGNVKLSTSGLLAKAREDKTMLPVGSRYSLFAAQKMIDSMKAYAIEQRYPKTAVTPKTEPVPGRPGYVFVVFEVEEHGRIYIRQTVFRGRESLPRKELLKIIKSRPGGFLRPSGKYDETMLNLDAMRIQNHYRNKGYSDARVEVLASEITPPLGRRKRRFATVTFDIREGRLYKYGPVNFKGLESLDQKEVRTEVYRILGVRVSARGFRWGFSPRFLLLKKNIKSNAELTPAGMPYAEDRVRAAAEKIKALLGETGRPFSRVLGHRVRTDDPAVVGVEFEIVEGPQATVGEVRIRGNTRTRDRIIRRELELFPGDIYDSRKLQQSTHQIRRRNLFSKVEAHNVPGEEPETVDIEYEVEETTTGMMQFGGTVSPDDGSVGATFQITESNFDWRNIPHSWDDLIAGGGFRGGGQRLSLKAGVTTSQKSFSLEYTNPWIWDTPEHYSVGGSLFHSDKDFDDYQDQRTGFSLKLGRILLHPKFRIYGKYTFQKVYLEGLDEDLPLEIIENDEGDTMLSSAEVGVSFDSRNDIFNPSTGVLISASEEIFGGPFGGDEDFRKTSMFIHGYIPLFQTWGYSHIIHTQLRADWANPFNKQARIPYYERLFGGGIGTVRGYDYRSLSPRENDQEIGGAFRAVQNIEYIFPLHRDVLRGVVFFDAGNVWAEEGEFQLHDQKRSMGVGLHLRAPGYLGRMPIKLYFSKPLNPSDDDDTELFQMTFSLLF